MRKIVVILALAIGLPTTAVASRPEVVQTPCEKATFAYDKTISDLKLTYELWGNGSDIYKRMTQRAHLANVTQAEACI